MMLILYSISFLGIFANIHALSCIGSDKEESISTIGLNRTILQAKLESLTVITNQAACFVQLVDSRFHNLFLLEFTEALKTENVSAGILDTSTVIGVTEENQAYFVNSLITGCSNVDLCDKQLILDYTDWFLQTKDNPFPETTLMLLRGEDETLEPSTANGCQKEFCDSRWSNKGTNIERRCFSMTATQFQAQTTFDTTKGRSSTNFHLVCDSRCCNDFDTASELRAIVEEQYDIAALGKILGFHEEPAGSTAGTTSVQYSSKITSTTTTITTTTIKTTTIPTTAVAAADTTTITTSSIATTYSQRFMKTILNISIILLIMYSFNPS